MAIPAYNEEMKKFIHGLLNHLVQSKGSDLFITAGFPPAMKLDGKLTPITDKPLTADQPDSQVRQHEPAADFETSGDGKARPRDFRGRHRLR